MFSKRLLKLIVLVGVTTVFAIAVAAHATSTRAMTLSVRAPASRGSSPEDMGLISPARVRAEIPSNFIQPLVPPDPSEFSADDYARVGGPHTLRDAIPSNFIYPLASDVVQESASAARVRAEIPSNFIQPVVPYEAGAYVRLMGPQDGPDEIPSEFIYPIR